MQYFRSEIREFSEIREVREVREVREEAYCTALPLLKFPKFLNFLNNINAPQQTTNHHPTQQTLSSTMATPTAKGRPLSLNALSLLGSLGRLGRLGSYLVLCWVSLLIPIYIIYT